MHPVEVNAPPHPSALGFVDEAGFPFPDQPPMPDLGKVLSQSSGPPVMAAPPALTCELPGGFFLPDGRIVRTATVRELTGFDEEHLSRIDMTKNTTAFLTKLLQAGVEELGGQRPTTEQLSDLLIGDRDALTLRIRQATYGDTVRLTLTCQVCKERSAIEASIDNDVPSTALEDPSQRTFTTHLRNGAPVEIALLTGRDHEVLMRASNLSRAETDTLVLVRSVRSIGGEEVIGEGDRDRILALSAGDRALLVDFINDVQPGPKLNDIPINCATCGERYPLNLTLWNLFRF